MATLRPGSVRGIRASRALATMIVVFGLGFLIGAGLLAIDQQRVIDANSRLQEQTVPKIIRFQRLARNLEQLRQEGEHIFAVSSQPARQQSMFLVTLVASHPSVLEHAGAARLASETERFLAEVVREAASDERRSGARYEEWQRLATRIGMQVDDISIEGIDLVSKDLEEATAAMRLARTKLMLALLMVCLSALAVMYLVRRHLIYPLQRIDQALANLSVDRPAPEFHATRMIEIQAIEETIREHHALLIQNDEVRQRLEQLANKDGLTGLTNRRHFMQTAEVELQRAQRYRRPVTVAMADLDYFKKLNDTYGHAAGDAVLRSFAELVLAALRQSDMVCRYGGEEFAFLFPEIGPDETALLAERLRAACEANEIALPDGRKVRVTVSIGLADASECPIEIALKRADDALYAAKHHGRNRVEVASPPVQPAAHVADPFTAPLF